jgi:hypothetical protein
MQGSPRPCVWGVGWACAGKAKRQAAMALLGCLEKLCSSNDPISAEQWARALRSRLLAGSDLEILDVDVLNNLAILYYSRMQYRRSLKAARRQRHHDLAVGRDPQGGPPPQLLRHPRPPEAPQRRAALRQQRTLAPGALLLPRDRGCPRDRAAVRQAFPSCTQPVLTEICLCHAHSC